METETGTTQQATTVRASAYPGLFIITHNGRGMTLPETELQAIVQGAYDVAGMVAIPSYSTEAARPSAAQQEWAERFHADLDRARLERTVAQ